MYPVWLFGGIIFGMGLLANLFVMVEHGDGSVLGMLFSLAVVASVAFGYASTKRSATITTPDYIEVRTLFGTRQTAWGDIQEIGTKGSKKMAQRVVIYDSSGRQIGLPFVNPRDITSFSEEVRVLRGLWERLRGPDWRPQRHGQESRGSE
ncbi:hypothetical protein GCM10023080_093780 [Streptomyces pseudoechinosporeus]